jgi:hypothetical protein
MFAAKAVMATREKKAAQTVRSVEFIVIWRD